MKTTDGLNAVSVYLASGKRPSCKKGKLLCKGLTSVTEKGILSGNNVYSNDWDFTQIIKQI